MLGNLKLAPKMIGGFALVAILCIVVGISGLISMSSMNGLTEEITGNQVPSLIGLDGMNAGAADIKRLENLAVIAQMRKDTALYDSVKKDLEKTWGDDFQKGWNTYEPLSQTEEEAKVWKDFVAKWGIFKEAHKQVMETLDRGDAVQGATLAATKSKEAFYGAMKDIDRLVEIQSEEAQKNEHKTQSVYGSARLILIAVTVIALVAAVVMGLFLSLSITRRLKTVADRAEHLRSVCITNLGNASESLARGDLDVKLEASTQVLDMKEKDELGAMAHTVDGIVRQSQATIASFNRALSAIKNLINETTGLTVAAQEGR